MEVRRGDGSVIAVEVAGEQGAAPVLLCNGLADSRLSARLFTQAARELGLPGGMQHDAEDADAPRRVLDHHQDIGLGAVEQLEAEEVARQDRLGLRTQELRPGWPGSSWRGVDAVGLEDLPYGRRRDLDSQAGQFSVDPAVSPFGISRASRRTRALIFRRVAGRPVFPRMDRAAQRRRTMSRCQRTMVSGVTRSRSP
jgi:hypothetical protein